MRDSRRQATLLVFVVFVASVLGACAYAGDNSHTSENKFTPNEANTVKVVKQAKPSIAAIIIRVEGKKVSPLKNMPPRMRQFFKHFFNGGQIPERKETELAAGSGFVIDDKGDILTNYHVVAMTLQGNSTNLKKNATITVRFGSDDELKAKVLGVDKPHDLALLRLNDPQKLPHDAQPLKLANSDQVQVGEKAIAIGNPFLLYSTVTQGIVSAVHREQASKVSAVPISYIQTDAAINPGSSGGPLLNSRGEVIGINDEILAPHGAFVGIGLAIPSNLVRDNLNALKKGKFLKQAMIGIAVAALSKYPAPVREQLRLPDHGLMIVEVKPDGPGDKAGLQGAQFSVDVNGRPWPAGGDIILKVDGQAVHGGRELQKTVFGKKAGSTVQLLILHKDQKKKVKVTLAALDSGSSE